MGEARRYQQRPDLLTRQAPGFVVLARVDGRSVSLPGSGAAVWALLDEARSVAEVGEALATTYDEDAAQIAADVEPLLEKLAESGFVTHV